MEKKKMEKFHLYNGDFNDEVWFAQKYNINYSMLKKRLSRGWSIERALSEPIQERRTNRK
ncbi:hypothetical protein [Planococcus shenhongbingii]|uniref:Phage protein n=1 Tax=Planococcus shenhongbingii TaxID=3058398 RepID=A0ABT8N7W4_9BACL|nr:hypothetical protein [Planococcus sp. N017]MDN7243971.1 hypothetical protein [Planococcus sp. N017]